MFEKKKIFGYETLKPFKTIENHNSLSLYTSNFRCNQGLSVICPDFPSPACGNPDLEQHLHPH